MLRVFSQAGDAVICGIAAVKTIAVVTIVSFIISSVIGTGYAALVPEAAGLPSMPVLQASADIADALHRIDSAIRENRSLGSMVPYGNGEITLNALIRSTLATLDKTSREHAGALAQGTPVEGLSLTLEAILELLAIADRKNLSAIEQMSNDAANALVKNTQDILTAA